MIHIYMNDVMNQDNVTLVSVLTLIHHNPKKPRPQISAMTVKF